MEQFDLMAQEREKKKIMTYKKITSPSDFFLIAYLL